MNKQLSKCYLIPLVDSTIQFIVVHSISIQYRIDLIHNCKIISLISVSPIPK